MEIADTKKRYLAARKAYYAGAAIMSDEAFDKLEDTIRKIDPAWKPLHSTGVRIGKKVTAKLTYPQPSLNKIATHEKAAIVRWVNKMLDSKYLTVCVMPKIDGASYQLTYKAGKPISLVTRGDGVHGEDVSHFLSHLNGLPSLDKTFNAVIRVEIAMPRTVFDKKWKGIFKSDRNLASGLFNRQDVHAAIKDMRVICLRNLTHKGTLSTGLEALERRGLQVVPYTTYRVAGVPWGKLEAKLRDSTPLTSYRTDGYVVHVDDLTPVTVDRPAHAFAYKFNTGEGSLTTIQGITWEASKHGALIPTAQIDPIEVDGATLRNVTINNASWARDRKLGVGAVVRVIRSGDIIPKIVEVVTPGEFKLPSVTKYGAYHWDDNKTHLLLDNPDTDDTVVRNRLNSFFTVLDIDHIGPKQVQSLVEAGVTSTLTLTRLTEAKLVEQGIGKAIAAKVAVQLDELRQKGVPLPKLMKASGVFTKGFGEKLTQRLIDAGFDLERTLEGGFVTPFRPKHLSSESVIGPVRGTQFMEEWPNFLSWYQKSAVPFKRSVKAKSIKAKSQKLAGQAFTWTGYRNTEQEELVKAHGGSVVGFGSKTTILLYQTGGKSSSKLEKAEAKGIQVLRWEQLVRKYQLM
jgi:NAD-dependent DNA ligase